MLRVRYFAGARAAAGVAEELLDAAQLAAGHQTTLGQLLEVLRARHGAPLARVLAAASFLVDGEQQRDPEHPLPPDSVVDVLPPFAGG